jgi:acetyl esterase/lipase
MPLHPQAAALIASAAGGKPVEEMTIEEGRAALEERVRLMGGSPQEVATVRDLSAGSVPVRVYAPSADQPLPALVFFHGGGWVKGSLQSHDVVCRALANGAGCVVVSVDYRLAPEHQFPAAIDDAFASVQYVAAHAAELGIDPDRLAVAGDSAGGNLAAGVALLARDSGGPRLVHQLLIYPVTDYNLDTASYLANADGFMLTREAMRFYWRHYLRSDADGDDPRASPLRASRFDGLPSALIITAEFDPLRDEGRAYASRLEAAGVPVTYSEYAGLVHGFVTYMDVIDQGKVAVAEASAALRAAFASPVAV